MTNPTFRLLDFQIKNEEGKGKNGQDNKNFMIQMFGMNEVGETCSIFVTDFTPFFYVKVGDDWGKPQKKAFIRHIKDKMRTMALKDKHKKWRKGDTVYPKPEKDEEQSEYIARTKGKYVSYYENSILDSIILENKKLYGFDDMKNHRFICIKFKNTTALNKVKNFWYTITPDPSSKFGSKYKLKTFPFQGIQTELYEAKLPPLLRYFHIQEINPSGWIELPLDKIIKKTRKTYCKYEYTIKSEDIVPLPYKEAPIPAIVASWDIEASSSHGDFPLAIKTYRKLVGDIITFWKVNKYIRTTSKDSQKSLIIKLIKSAFGFGDPVDGIANVFPKKPVTEANLMENIYTIIGRPLKKIIDIKRREEEKENRKNSYRNREDDDDDEIHKSGQTYMNYVGVKKTFLDYLNDNNCDIGKKLEIIDEAVTYIFSGLKNDKLLALEGDKVTFIGTTFMRVGETEPYLNYMAVLGDCDEIGIEKSETIVECFETERDMLMGWTEMMQEYHPDILIGYNTFGFDWKFICQRAEELNCMGRGGEEEISFSALSRNKGELCKKIEKEIRVASGTHQMVYMDMPGIIQVDLYNYFRREVNLGSYKLNDVASHFIGDMIKGWDKLDDNTVIKSGNLMGLQKGNFVCFELIGHSVDSYKNGKKFKVLQLNENKGEFIVEGNIDLPSDCKLRWGLGKDDITPHQIFELANGSPSDRAIIAKYCFQDCNLVHHLFRKNDILTGMSEQASICSVPIDFVVMRGQGIKLLSFIAKKCRQKNTLMPVVEKPEGGGSYEGAICLPPKTGLYTEDPVAVNDYSSLYPSCMISENISHDSKVWTKEYDLGGDLLSTTGERNSDGNFKYDNLDNYEYVDVEYDRYEWITKPDRKKDEKIKVGTKICRFAQFPDNKKAIMPSTLQGLLAARKATRAKIKFKTVTMKNGDTHTGMLSDTENEYIITLISLDNERLKKVKTTVNKKDVDSIADTYNAFMKNVFNQRQSSIKIVANSLYGQCGAKTSSFYDIDIAASTTATGRKLLIYSKRIIEEVYGDAVCDTKYGKVKTNAEYIYGDTDSVFFTFHLKDMEGNKIRGKKALEITIELSVEVGEIASKFLKEPHYFEYEKTFDPFLLLSKKRYVGMLFEHDPNKGKRKEMGIVLKRRDNAPIVKDVYGGLIDILMNAHDIPAAIMFVKKCLQEIVDEKFPIEKLIITKKLNSFYKNPESIAHKVLAERMGKRDSGNKPSVGSRVPFVYIQTKGNVRLQGDKIESPDYIRANGIRPDYGFYITNQLMKPIQQVFSLILEDIPNFKRHLPAFKRKCEYLKQEFPDVEKYKQKEDALRNKEVKKIIFDDALRQANNIKNGQKTIKRFFA
uniref:DNA-directed DNA polymerase n=1 Tax=viral metagenome TaxID=1070528 RepID=A0A6C0C5E7_9ZZZZ